MPLNLILNVEIFYVWGIDLMRPFPPSFGYEFILVGLCLQVGRSYGHQNK
jgi:hypothetical protein